MMRKRRGGLRYGLYRRKKPKRRPPKVDRFHLAEPGDDNFQQIIPAGTRVSRIAELMAEVALLRNAIVPCRPAIDIGVDLVTCCGGVLKRVQVKGQATNGKNEDTFTFSTCRCENGVRTPYKPGEIDAFIFVHTEKARFFIVPAATIIRSKRCTITFSPTVHDYWENAWCVLTKKQCLPTAGSSSKKP